MDHEHPAYRKMRPTDQFLYDCLQENTLQLRAVLLNQGLERPVREGLFDSIKDCRALQQSLLGQQTSEIETTQVEIRSFRIKGTR